MKGISCMYMYIPFFLDLPLSCPHPIHLDSTEHLTEPHVLYSRFPLAIYFHMVAYIRPFQAPSISLLYRLAYLQILLVHGFTVSELIRFLESIDSNFSYLPTTKEKKLSCRGERLSQVPYPSLCLLDFPTLLSSRILSLNR